MRATISNLRHSPYAMFKRRNMIVHAISIHTGSFPTEELESVHQHPHRWSCWKQRAVSVVVHAQRRLSIKVSLADEQAQIKEIISSLSMAECDTAARTNYEYLMAVDDENLKHKSIYTAVQRVLRSKDHSLVRATETLRNTLDFRRIIGIDDLRLAFSGPEGKAEYEPLYEELSKGMVYVQGYDKHGRSTYIFEPQRVTNTQMELDWTIRMHVYTLERAIACSKCPDKRVNAVVNFQNFSVRKHKPPMDLGIEFMQTLRSHYSGHVNNIFLIDPPRTFLCLWAVFAPFLAAKTKEKIHFVSGSAQKRKVIGALYEVDQVPSWMLPEGTLNHDIDWISYLRITPFDKTFGEECYND